MDQTFGCTRRVGGDTDGIITKMVLGVAIVVELEEAGMGVEIGVDTWMRICRSKAPVMVGLWECVDNSVVAVVVTIVKWLEKDIGVTNGDGKYATN